MKNNSIKISSIVSQQLPEFVRIEFPLVEEFLKSYYDSLESSFSPYDIVRNLTNYIKIDDISHLSDDFILNTSISSSDDEFVIYSKTNNLKGLPRELGFLQINEEIILYRELTRFDDDGSDLKVTVNNKEYFAVKLIGCSRGFSAVVDLTLEGTEDQLLFQESSASPHNQGDSVSNLSIIFFIEFLKKIKNQFLPGFEDRKLADKLNQNIFIKQSKDFYSSKGSDTSFKILFRALYDKNVKVIKPSDNVIEPSIANYRVVRNAVIERIQGDPLQLLNRTLYQDASLNIPAARGTISKVEKTFKNNREYFLISIDDGYERDINYRGTIFSSFTVHPKTTVTTSIISGDTFIDVDSTVSFPESGTLVFFTSVDGSSPFVETRITYESKSLTQFFGCKSEGSQDIQVEFDSGKEIYLDVYAYGILDPKTNEQIKIRITGVLDEFEIPEKNYLYRKNDPIKIKNLGINSNNKRDNNWIFNVPVFYNIIDAELENQVTNEYTIFFADDHNFSKSDTFIINEIPGLFASIVSISSKKSLAVRFFRTDGLPIILTIEQIKTLSVTKEVIKAKIKNYPNLNVFSSNVQNTYIDDSGNLYVASQSIPGYSDLSSGGNIEIDVKDGSITGTFRFGVETIDDQNPSPRTVLFEGQNVVDYSYFTVFDENGPIRHGFYTGDAVIFRSLDGNSPIPDGIYYVKEFKNTNEPSGVYGLKLSKSLPNILNRQFIEATEENSTGQCILQFFDYSVTDRFNENYLSPKTLDSQRLLRKISSPTKVVDKKITPPNGRLGLFVNGVEILNYKSNDYINFGAIEAINVTSGGFGYDVINTAPAEINDFGGSLVNYNSRGGTALFSNGIPIVFGASGGDVLFINQTGGSALNIDGSTLNLGTDEVTFNGLGGTPLRINGNTVSLGGVGGTRLYTGGSGGVPVIINGEKLTVGNVGSGAIVYPSIVGSLERIDIIDPGFNYINQPTISISGGNGIGAKATANVTPSEYEIFFDALESSNFLNINTNTIGFSTYHKFLSGEEIRYRKGITNELPGLSDNSNYFVNVVSPTTITLHTTSNDAVIGINTVNIINYSNGRHFIKSVKPKRKITSITIEDSGSNYQTKLTSTTPNNISLIDNTILIKNHGYLEKEKIIHYSSGSTIGGLEEGKSYYVTVIDKDRIKLSKENKNNLNSEDFLYKTKQYVNLTNKGSGTLFFNYEPIKVSINGIVGITTFNEETFNAKLNPIFRGSVQSFFVENGGSEYGSRDILNYVRSPEILLKKGFNASVFPIITSGTIKSVIVTNPGDDYYSIPDIIVRSNSGVGAILVAEIENLKLKRVIVVSGGIGYTNEDIQIDIISRGEGFTFEPVIKSWNVNTFKRFEETDRGSDDGGFLVPGSSDSFGLQYTHIYLTNFLRDLIYSETDAGFVYTDLLNDTEIVKRHSPIVGWAYDGNPIYGPYGFSNGISGQVKALKSGYSVKQTRTGGPEETLFPLGFFVEDYEYKISNNGDLDEQNGRFCITPDFPNGTYAYFCSVEQVGGNIIPKFPFIIGNKFNSLPIDFNFDPNSNQSKIDINQQKWNRNINYYNLRSKNSGYNFIKQTKNNQDPVAEVGYASPGLISDVDIIFGGNNYKVGETVEFKNKNLAGNDASAIISQVSGVDVFDISTETKSFENNFEYIKNNSRNLIGFGTIPHGFVNNEIVSTITPIERIISSNITVVPNILSFTKQIEPADDTDDILWFNVSGNLKYPNIRENDFYKSNDEIVKVLNIDEKNSRIKVYREQLDTSGLSTHNSGDLLIEQPRKFGINIGIQTQYNYTPNYELYFKSNVVSYGFVGTSGTITVEDTSYSEKNIQVPLRTIYIPNHNLETNQPVEYNSIIGSSLKYGTDDSPSSKFSILDGQTLYAVRITNDLVGLSTSQVAISSEGNVVNKFNLSEKALLYFNDTSVGEYHSLKTLKSSIYRTEVEQNIVTITTLENHNLSNNDTVNVSVKPKDTLTYVVKYSDEARVLIINPRNFLGTDVDTNDNTIFISKHGYKTGDKILYQSSTPISTLENENSYFVVVISEDKISLVSSFYESQLEIPSFIELPNQLPGTISQINPKLDIIKNQTVIFDLSDETLSFGDIGGLRTPAFKFNLYYDKDFQYEYYSSDSSTTFDVIREGDIGIPSTDPLLRLTLRSDTPKNLFYRLVPDDISNNPEQKRGIIVDTEQNNNNKISTVNSIYDGEYTIFGITDKTFKYQTTRKNQFNYENNIADITYTTTSKTAFGSIDKLNIVNKGSYFFELPSETNIITENGFDAVLYGVGSDIGTIKGVSILDKGFDYPSDLSVRPFAQLPTIFRLDPLYSILSVFIKKAGINYLSAPDLIVFDTKSETIINDVLISFELGDDFATIEQNTKELFNRTPRIIPVNNSNGIEIVNATLIESASTNNTELQRAIDNQEAIEEENFGALEFPDSTRVNETIWLNIPTIKLTLGVQYSDILDFPFDLGDRVFIENVSTTEQALNSGYNSANYKFAFFTVIRRDPKLGGDGANIELNFTGFLDPNIDEPAESLLFEFDEFTTTAARVVPVKYFPEFETKLIKNEFLIDENILSSNQLSSGSVVEWNTSNDYIFLDVDPVLNNFSVGDSIIGQSSKTKAFILNILDFNSRYIINASSIQNEGWTDEKGFLNTPSQRVHDSDYYQYFSYALNSEIPLSEWDEVVGNLNHTAGFKRFSNLEIPSTPKLSGITTSQNTGTTFGINDLIGNVSTNCYYDFDLVTELNFEILGNIKSNQIIFGSRILKDYIESISNRVLPVDDISKNFRSDPRDSAFSIIDRTDNTSIRSKKYFLFIADRETPNTTEALIVNSIHDNTDVYLTQYGRVETDVDLGYFEGLLVGDAWNLQFFPTFADVNNYLLDFVAFEMTNDIDDLDQIKLGDVALVENQLVDVSAGTASAVTVVGIASTYRNSKIQLQISNDSRTEFELNEISVLHDDNGNVSFLEYGELVTNGNGFAASPGIGTYGAEMSTDGNTLEVKFTPNVALTEDWQFKSIVTSVGNTTYTDEGFLSLEAGEVRSITVSIAASTAPVPVKIGGFTSQYKTVYSVTSVQDTLNNQYRASELQLISDNTNTYLSEFGILYDPPVGIAASFVGIGTFTAQLSGSNTDLLFTPLPYIPVTINIFQMSVGRF